jgi:hypothetical protein
MTAGHLIGDRPGWGVEDDRRSTRRSKACPRLDPGDPLDPERDGAAVDGRARLDGCQGCRWRGAER